MQLRYNYRLYPAPGQRQALARAFGCARVVFNDGLCARQEAHAAGRPYLTDGELSARLTAAKARPERAWLGEVSSVVLQQALADLTAAYRNFFASVAGTRKGPRVGPPRFRSRKDRRQAIRFTRNARFAVTAGGKLRLPKIGDVEVCWSRDLPAGPSSVTVIKDAAGRYFASFVVQAADEPLPPSGAEAGIDLGLTHFAVLSDGRKVASPRFLRRAERKLRTAQKALSRKAPGSSNRGKARVRVARVHARVADARRDWLHKESTRIIRDRRCTWRTCAWPGSAGPGWPSRCTTLAGRRSCTCWNTRPPGTGARSPGPAGSSPPASCARPAGPRMVPSRWASAPGRARRAARCTTAT
jgi:putative transposase